MDYVHIHIPKTGSTSSLKFFPNCIRYGKHINVHKLNQDLVKTPDTVSFTIIREPKERFISCIKHVLRAMGNNTKWSQDDIVDVCLNHGMTDEEIATGQQVVYAAGNNREKVEAKMAIHSVSIFHSFLNVFDRNGEPYADHLIDFRNINQEIAGLAGRQTDTFPKVNSSPGTITLKKEQWSRFEERFADDLVFYEKFLKTR